MPENAPAVSTAPASSIAGSATSTSATTTATSPPAASPPAAAPSSSPPAVESALSSLEKVAAAATASEAASSAAIGDPTSTSSTETGEGRPPASTEPASSAPAPAGQKPRSTEAPEPRIVAAVRNAREETRAEVTRDFETRYGKPDDVQRAVELTRRLFANPQEFFRQLASELKEQGFGEGHPSAPAAEPELVDPRPDLRSEDGKLAYSDEANRQIAANAAERVRRELRKEFGPALDYTRTAEENARQTALQATIRVQGEQTATKAMAAARQLPHFTAHEKEIGEVYAAIPIELRREVGSVAALYMAYNKVLADTVLPTLGATTERQVIADLHRSATAGASGVTIVPPAQAKPVIREGNVDDLARHLERKHAEALAAH